MSKKANKKANSYAAAYARKQRVAAAAKKTVTVTAPSVAVAEPVMITGHDNIMAHFAARQEAQKRAADSFLDSMANNYDFTLMQEADFSSKYHNVAGKKFQVNIFVGGAASAALAKKSGLDVGAVVQIWRGSKSVLVAQTKSDLNNARLNWENKARIAANDVVSQSISLIRLSAPEHPVLTTLAIELAYNNDGVDAAGIHSVWD